MEPSRTAGEERRKAEERRLRDEEAAWDSAEKEALQHQERELQEWQEETDSEENLQCLPHLTLADIQDMPEDIPTEVRDMEGTQVLVHDIPTGGILYVTAFFDITDRTEEELSRISFLTEILGKIATRRSTPTDLLNRSRLYCGNIDFSTATFSKNNDGESYKAKLVATFSTLPKNLEAAVALVTEVLSETQLLDEEAVRNLLKQDRGDMQQQMAMAGHSLGLRRLTAMFTGAGVVNECTDGLTYYEWMKKQEENWDWTSFQNLLTEELHRCVNPNKMMLSITGGTESDVQTLVTEFRDGLPSEEFEGASSEAEGQPAVRPWGARKEGIVIPADISFAIRGGDITKFGTQWNGELSLAARIVSYAYLWNIIRVQGGAYGTGLTAGVSGLTACYSYRDPKGAESLNKYETVGTFLKEFTDADPDLTGFIIGAVSESSRVLTPRLKGNGADSMYLSGRTYEDRCIERRRVLNSTPEKLAKYAEPLAKAIAEGGIVLVGGKNQLEAYGELDRVITV